MAEGKRYYWLKLKDDFFSSKRVKKLRRLAGGDTYLIIYLKMQLKALKTDGMLTWTGLEENFADELALDLDEEPDDVKVTLQFLLSCGLIETSDDVNFLLPYVAENTGSETAATQRWRDWKARQEALDSNALPTQSNALPTHDQHIANVEKEIEKEKEIEIEKDSLAAAMDEFTKFRKTMKKPLTDRARELILKDLQKYAPDDVDTQIAILNQSIKRGWVGVFPLKEEQDRNTKISADPSKWANDDSFKKAIGDLLNEK